jgi:hypothetical protein
MRLKFCFVERVRESGVGVAFERLLLRALGYSEFIRQIRQIDRKVMKAAQGHTPVERRLLV